MVNNIITMSKGVEVSIIPQRYIYVHNHKNPVLASRLELPDNLAASET